MTASLAKRSSVSRPAQGEVQLWLCPLQVACDLPGTVLSAEERQRYRQRPDAAAGRVWLRHQLSRYHARDPSEWCFTRSEHGKPLLLDDDLALHFNLSHSADWIALAVGTTAAVGVDIQWHDPERDIERIAARYFPAAELSALQVGGRLDRRRLFDHWSLKECWAKARGGALPTALAAVAFAVDGGQLVCSAPDAGGESLCLMSFHEYSLAVSSLAEPLRLKVRVWQSDGTEAPFEPAYSATTMGVRLVR